MQTITTRRAVANTLGARQEPHVITQTLTRQSTTITTLVTLGGPPTQGSGDQPNPDAGSHGESHGLTKGQIGAIIGSALGFVLIVLVLWCCCTRRRKQTRVTVYEYSSYDSSYIVGESPQPRAKVSLQQPPPVAERIPGGPRYPTYRAIPIPNPRRAPRVPHVY